MRFAPMTATIALLCGWIAQAPPLRALGQSLPEAKLRLSFAYLVLAPYCDLLDTVTLLSVRQHLALLLSIAGAYVAWRWHRRRSPFTIRPALRREFSRGAALVAAIVIVYAVGALAPRPMAALQLAAPADIAIDFHSHTDASWDGRRGFTAEDNRRWHRDAGFDVSYVSDHGTITGAMTGMAGNPTTAAGGTLILPAAEVRCAGEHLVILGATARDTAADCDSTHSRMTTHRRRRAGDERIALLTIPGRLSTGQRLPEAEGVEIADGAPRGLDQMRLDVALLAHVADSAGLARVSGSNNHGWGRTAAAWSVMSIGGWRSMTPDSLDVAIRRQLLRAPFASVRVIERAHAPPGTTPVALAATLPMVGWTLLTAMSLPERLAWLCWIWLVPGLAVVRRANQRTALSRNQKPEARAA